VKSKTCSRCLQPRDLNKFRSFTKELSKGDLKEYTANVCTPCIVIRNREWRRDKQDILNKAARERRHARKIRAIEYKGGVCEHCKKSFHSAAFDFHHINPSEKELDPGLMMGLLDEKLFKELDKCILLCANCHRVHHFKLGDLGRIKKCK